MLLWHHEYGTVDVLAYLDDVFRTVGVDPERKEHRDWVRATRELEPVLQRLVRPRALVRIGEVVRLTDHHLVLGDDTRFSGQVRRFLEHSAYIAVFVATIGSAAERLSRGWLRHGRTMYGTLLDALASAAVEAVAQQCQDDVRRWARKRGQEISPRYSPGYCGFDLDQQRVIFDLLPTRTVSVRLTKSCLMLPLKTVSGLIGIGPADKLSPSAYACETCGHPDCGQRRAPLAEGGGSCYDGSAHPSDSCADSERP